MIDEIINKIQTQDRPQKKGGNKQCWIVGAYALLKGRIKPSNTEATQQVEQSLYNQGVAIVPTIEYKIVGEPNDLGYADGYILQRKAPGEELYEQNISEERYYQRISQLAEQPQEFYDRFVHDYLTISENGLMIDSSKSSNFFYTPEKIHFIDLNFTGSTPSKEYLFYDAATSLLNGSSTFKYNKAKPLQMNILRKLSASFVQNGADPQKILHEMQRIFPDATNKDVLSTQPHHQQPPANSSRSI